MIHETGNKNLKRYGFGYPFKEKEKMEKEYEEVGGGEVIKLEKPNEQVTGLYKGIEESKQFKDSYALRLRIDGEDKILFVNNIVKDKIEQGNVEIDNEIRITFLGKVKNVKGDRQYNSYKVERAK